MTADTKQWIVAIIIAIALAWILWGCSDNEQVVTPIEQIDSITEPRLLLKDALGEYEFDSVRVDLVNRVIYAYSNRGIVEFNPDAGDDYFDIQPKCK